MGFHVGRLVVGLRTFFVLAITLGTFILAIGLYALFGVDLTDRSALDGAEMPNLVLVLVAGGIRDGSTVPAPSGHMLSPALSGSNTWTAAEDPADAWQALMRVRLRGGAGPERLPRVLARLGYGTYVYTSKRAAEEWRDFDGFDSREASMFTAAGRDGVPAPVHYAATWLRQDGPRSQPFFLVVEAERGDHDDPSSAEAADRLVAALAQTKLLDRTAVLVTAVVGADQGQPAQRFRVPLLLRYPARLPASVEVAAPLSTADVAPTLAQLAGLRPACGPASGGCSILQMRLEENYRTAVVIHTAAGTLVTDGVRWNAGAEGDGAAALQAAMREWRGERPAAK